MRTPSRERTRIAVLVGRYALIAVWMLFTLLPLYAAFVASLTKYENLGKSFLYPTDWQWSNYIDIFSRVPILDFLKATLIYAVGASVVCVVLAVLAAYALSRFRFRGKRAFVSVVFLTQLVPQVIIVVPMFMMLSDVGLYDTYAGVILVIAATGVAFPILLLRSFFDGLPLALEEAAAVDGASRLGILWRIVLPLSAPGLATAFALSFFTGWGQYLYPLVLTRSPEHTPVTVGIGRLIDNTTPWEMVMTGTIIAVIPAVIAYMLVQKFLTNGLMVGAVK
ncbi:carbohydrate ABC transporter permease [Paramicrobacterium chengjingii]|uniref:Carbohydrate ABC transporter permease n=1 Tax=Paramicrobacterium chengjingii TaxID=2769067 RepID=A0ABX6YI30_9MICO|nr:carbohydrate ABC transporter permease [Microbacterium chengjingii]QPZ38254.1 carbohydrate ABC transporter permease [Microbacterium chengjingii]